MPRPKGSKNKKAFEQMESIENIDERIAATAHAMGMPAFRGGYRGLFQPEKG